MFGQFRESIVLHRDVDGITVPNGEPAELPAGTLAVVNQALGGSFTITVHGNMYRIDGQDKPSDKATELISTAWSLED